MNKESLYDLYLKKMPQFEDVIEALEDDNRTRILNGLKKESDRNNFRSKLSELRFGFAFTQLGFHPSFEIKLLNFKPDWICEVNEATALFEVYKLNRSLKDQTESSLEEELFQGIEKIKKNVWLKIGICDEFKFNDLFSVDYVNECIVKWLTEKERSVNEQLLISNKLQVTVVRVGTKNDHILCCSECRPIDQKPGKLVQLPGLDDNEITKKLFKYNSIIDGLKLPYFLCVDIDFVSGFHYDDFVEYFWYSSAEYLGYKGENSWKNGVSWNDLGRFYDPIVKNYLSGIIVLDNKIFRLLLNPFKGQLIYSDKYKEFLDRLKLIEGECKSKCVRGGALPGLVLGFLAARGGPETPKLTPEKFLNVQGQPVSKDNG